MTKIQRLSIFIFGILTILLSACSYKEFEDSLKDSFNKEMERDEIINTSTIPERSSEDEESGLFFVGDTISITDSDNETVEYTLQQVHFSENIHELGLKKEDFTDRSLIDDNGDIHTGYQLVTIDVKVKNIDYKGFEFDDEQDKAFLCIEPTIGFREDIEAPDGPWTLEASYFSEHQPLDQDRGKKYYWFYLGLGEEIEATVGWFVPADQIKEDPLYYIIGSGGNAEDYLYFQLTLDEDVNDND
ncbi:hypothetical protein SAMN05421736_13322 [Evansella caseinilytica]|uniref:Uncharacterized protein n=1 Tax=Evansella caseinilytica TaxID=1503961 RepID=A0A1H3V0Y4_9BACI|nr:hypothetical protein [Evansella caseinilytica]SDZ68277.1 hypothetical protein SAMN05421736_13322 [Evansella caseinilytica]